MNCGVNLGTIFALTLSIHNIPVNWEYTELKHKMFVTHTKHDNSECTNQSQLHVEARIGQD